MHTVTSPGLPHEAASSGRSGNGSNGSPGQPRCLVRSLTRSGDSVYPARRQARQRAAYPCPWGLTRSQKKGPGLVPHPPGAPQGVTPSVHVPARSRAVVCFLKTLTSSVWPPYITGLVLLTVFCTLHALAFGALQIWGQSVPPWAGQCFETAKGHRGQSTLIPSLYPRLPSSLTRTQASTSPALRHSRATYQGPPPDSPEHPGIIQTS